MKTTSQALLSLFGAAVVLLAQPHSQPAAPAIVELRGTIASVNLAPGGMPSLVVNPAGGRPTTVRLGSIRYLIAHNFNPKAGQTVIVRGFPQPEVDLVAVSVECPELKQKLVLRDEHGMPLWRGGLRTAAPPR